MGQKESKQLFQSHLHSIQKIKLALLFSLAVLFAALFASSCANRGVITGGEKDTIPPELVSSVPFNQSLDYKGTEILLTFNERIQAPQLKRKLLITPFTDTPYKIKINKNVLQLTFEKSFDDSTTYTLNFADAVADVTENNPAQKVSIAFSTWHIIDSLSIAGEIVDYMSDQPIEGAAVSVYQAEDTVDIFSDKPYYFTFTDKQGRFTIENMKGGLYRIYAFKDENSNYLNEPANEAHGFIPDTFLIDRKVDSLKVGLILQDVQDLRFVNSRSNGNQFEVRYNKYIDEYSVQPLDSALAVFPNILSSDHLTVRFFNIDLNEGDSTGYYLNVRDSVGNKLADTLYVKFNDREVRKDKFEFAFTPANNKTIRESFDMVVQFNKPVVHLNPDSLLLKYDTLLTVPIDSIGTWDWNRNRSQLSLKLKPDKTYLPGKLNEFLQLQDSLAEIDSVQNNNIDSAALTIRPSRKINPDAILVYFGKGAFISAENDTSQISKINYTFKKPEKFGKISGKIEIDSVHFIIQLINDKYQKINEIADQKDYLFDYIPPGKYNIRVLVDTNNDGKWSYGNIKHGNKPEEIYFHPTFIELRENWEINNIDFVINRL